jgi:hypothetical protein
VDTEAPSTVKARLVEEGRYQPALKLKTLQRSRGLKESGLLQDGQRIKDLFDDEGEAIKPLAGEVVREVPLQWRARRRGGGLFCARDEDGRSGGTRLLTVEDVGAVEEELMMLSRDIIEEWDKRQTQTSLDMAAFAALGEKFDWGADHGRVVERGVTATVAVEHTGKMKELLQNLLGEMPVAQAEKFNVNTMLQGYASFLKYRTQETDSMLIKDHDIYQAWYKKFFDSEIHANFSKLFQNIQIQTASEVTSPVFYIDNTNPGDGGDGWVDNSEPLWEGEISRASEFQKGDPSW